MQLSATTSTGEISIERPSTPTVTALSSAQGRMSAHALTVRQLTSTRTPSWFLGRKRGTCSYDLCGVAPPVPCLAQQRSQRLKSVVVDAASLRGGASLPRGRVGPPTSGDNAAHSL